MSCEGFLPNIHECALQNIGIYQNLVNGVEEVESQLAGCLAEHLNAEIVLRTISDVSMAIEWLKSTFMYTRVSHTFLVSC